MTSQYELKILNKTINDIESFNQLNYYFFVRNLTSNLGKIYSYNFHEDQNCQAQFPLLLNYNKGRLTGFELLWKLDFSSPYLEHPDKGLLKVWYLTITFRERCKSCIFRHFMIYLHA